MLFPLYEKSTQKEKPIITLFIILFCLFVFAVCIFFNLNPALPQENALVQQYMTDTGVSYREATYFGLFVHNYAFRSGSPDIVSAILSLFLHSNIVHVIINMYILYLFGRQIEIKMGPIIYAFFFFFTGIVSFYCHAMYSIDSPSTTVIGASGSIFGVLGAHLLLFSRERIKTLVFLPPLVFQTVKLPTKMVFLYYFLIVNLLPLMVGKFNKTSYVAHISGFLIGILFVLLWSLLDRRISLTNPFQKKFNERT